ncbi:TerD family protein [Pseudomonas japonica]|uniref:TerD family protein n=1 Tax=Pseudomonas japonica TaxID=256466 RepID=UPI0015E3E2C4|nr:TerD family protein [Pseudomonas japonica]MBA1243206.1 TerD family protein [Pseudomonas japonica]
MTLSLSKQQSVSLDKASGGPLARVTLGLGWDPIRTGFLGKFMRAGEIDLDASCIVFDNALNRLDLVWFRQLASKDGAIVHSGDNRTGQGDGDDETLEIDLLRLLPEAAKLVFTVNSFTGQTFESVQNAYCRILDASTGMELARFDLSEKGRHTGIVMACLSREAGGWAFKALGATTDGRTAEDLASAAAKALRS